MANERANSGLAVGEAILLSLRLTEAVTLGLEYGVGSGARLLSPPGTLLKPRAKFGFKRVFEMFSDLLFVRYLVVNPSIRLDTP